MAIESFSLKKLVISLNRNDRLSLYYTCHLPKESEDSPPRFSGSFSSLYEGKENYPGIDPEFYKNVSKMIASSLNQKLDIVFVLTVCRSTNFEI